MVKSKDFVANATLFQPIPNLSPLDDVDGQGLQVHGDERLDD